MSLEDLVCRDLYRDEGSRATVYQDGLGYWTIGVGRCVDPRKPGCGLRPDEIAYLLKNDIGETITQLSQGLVWFPALDDSRKGVLANMAFELGFHGLLGFHRMLTAIADKDYGVAASEMRQSLWYKQTPKRAERLAKQMESGQWQPS